MSPPSGSETRASEKPADALSFHGGLLGALVPLAVFLCGVAVLALAGAPDERGFWPVLVAALAVSLLLARERYRWCDVVIDGMSQRLVTLMVLAWLLAGLLAELMNASGFVEALGWLAAEIGLAGAPFTVAAFLTGAAVSTATGTSLGTLILTVPLLHPAGIGLGADPVVLLGALIGGATFGDNISPVSDTTIASAATQGAEMGWVVRSRMRYALPAAAIAILVFAVIGGGGARTDDLTAAAASPSSLLMLLAPATVFLLLLRGAHLVQGLLLGNLVALGIGLALGRIRLAQLIYIDHDAFVARGLISDGLERGIGISVFTLLLMGLISTLTATGMIERLVIWARSRAHSRSGAEAWIASVTSIVVLLTTHAVVTILAVGSFASDLGREWKLSRTRRANLLDLTVSTWPFLLPWFIPTILASSLAAGSEPALQRISALQLGMANAHSWALLAILIFAIVTGYGRDSDRDREAF